MLKIFSKENHENKHCEKTWIQVLNKTKEIKIENLSAGKIKFKKLIILIINKNFLKKWIY